MPSSNDILTMCVFRTWWLDTIKLNCLQNHATSMFRLHSYFFRPLCEYCAKRAVQKQSSRLLLTRRNVIVLSTCRGLVPKQPSQLATVPYRISAVSVYRFIHGLSRQPNLSNFLQPQKIVLSGSLRHVGGAPRLIGVLGRMLKLRYLVLTGAVGGGVTLSQVNHQL